MCRRFLQKCFIDDVDHNDVRTNNDDNGDDERCL